MSEEIDKHVLRKYEIVSKLGKGVSARRACAFPAGPWGACARRRVRVQIPLQGRRAEPAVPAAPLRSGAAQAGEMCGGGREAPRTASPSGQRPVFLHGAGHARARR